MVSAQEVVAILWCNCSYHHYKTKRCVQWSKAQRAKAARTHSALFAHLASLKLSKCSLIQIWRGGEELREDKAEREKGSQGSQ